MGDVIHMAPVPLGSVINKKVDLHLQYFPLVKRYQVVSITSTVIYKPGEWLMPEVVDACCRQDGWSVTMVHDHILARIIGLLTGGAGAAIGAGRLP